MSTFLEIGSTIFGLIQGLLVMWNKRSNWIAYVIQMAFLVAFTRVTSCSDYEDATKKIVQYINNFE